MCVIATLVWSGDGLAQGASELRGQVVRRDTNTPVSGASVRLPRVRREATTDSLGRFRFSELPGGRFVVLITAAGFVSDSVDVYIMSDEVFARTFALRPGARPPEEGAADGASAEPLLRASVVDTNGLGVAYANVEINGVRRIADEAGRIRLPVDPPQRLTLHVRRIGYRPRSLDLEIGGDTTVSIALVPAARVLSGTVVTATQPRKSLELSGFYRRTQDREKGINNGHFITEEEIERRNPQRITQMFEGMTGVRVARRPAPGTGRSCLALNDPECSVVVGRGECPMTVYLDGKRLNPVTRTPETSYAFATDAVVPPSHVAGVEVYGTATRAPPEYQALNAMCGVILIWTK